MIQKLCRRPFVITATNDILSAQLIISPTVLSLVILAAIREKPLNPTCSPGLEPSDHPGCGGDTGPAKAMDQRYYDRFCSNYSVLRLTICIFQ
jgi:hypothetical protein